MEILIAFLCGAVIPFAVQWWVFYKEDKKKEANQSALLLILNRDIKEYYMRIFIGAQQYYCAEPYWLLTNYKEFNTANKHAMWPELMKTDVFFENPEIFGRINDIIHKLEMLNKKMCILIPERHNINAGSIEVSNWRHLMDEIKKLYLMPNEGDISYAESPLGTFFTEQIKILID